jgi:serine/threonine-protein kinase
MTAESSVILGSVSYLSPEQVQRGIADSRSDVYAVGITSFEIFTGKKPFEGAEPIQVAYMHVNDRVPRISSIHSDIPSDLDDLIYRATAGNADDRPRDAAEFHSQLLAINARLNPKENQLSLELDIPIKPMRPEKRQKSLRRRAKELTAPIPKVEVEKSVPITKETTSQVAKRKKASKRVRRNRKIAVGLAVILGITGWYTLIGPGSRVVVPSTVGATEAELTAALSPLGLTSMIVERRYSEDIEANRVIESIPAGGGKLDPGGTVKIVLSKGPERYTVPMLQGLTPEAAINLIQKSPLRVAPILEVFDATVPKGYVISAKPAVGTKVKRNTTITLTVSKGIEQVALASYIGKSGEQALNELTEAGFKVTSTYAFNETRLAGEVVSQTPAGGGTANKGGAVSLVISKGTQYAYIPNLYSIEEAKAVRTLQDLGLKVIVKKIGKKSVKKVTNIVPKVGTKVKRGAAVTITVG